MNPNLDVARAAEELRRAADLLVGVTALPIERGARVVWTHNGIVWERISGNAWRAVSKDGEPFLDDPDAPPSSSAHVASIPFEVLS